MKHFKAKHFIIFQYYLYYFTFNLIISFISLYQNLFRPHLIFMLIIFEKIHYPFIILILVMNFELLGIILF